MSDYIDLDLPSGKLWKSFSEEGFYTFDEAVEKFGKSIPSREDFYELLRNTSKKWDVERKGVTFTGKNGNTLFLPANGGTEVGDSGPYGFYWSSTSEGDTEAYCIYFDDYGMGPNGNYDRNDSHSVVLIAEKNER